MLVFPKPDELENALKGLNKLENVTVQLQGMIEGKRLNRLMNNTLRPPPWKHASEKNNVIVINYSEHQNPLDEQNLGQIIKSIKDKSNNSQMAIYRKTIGGDPDLDPEYSSKATDLSSIPLLEIVRAVGTEYMASKDSVNKVKDFNLKAINLGAQGKNSALVNEKSRQIWSVFKALGSYLNPFSDSDLAQDLKVRTMHYIAKSGVDKKECLKGDEAYVLVVSLGDHKKGGKLIGRAELKYNSP